MTHAISVRAPFDFQHTRAFVQSFPPCACDLVVASDDAVFGTPEINVGLWPYMITVPLLRSMPPKTVLDLMMTGRRVGAEEGARIGFVQRVVPVVEALSIDEAFLDVHGLEHISGTPVQIAARLRREVLKQVGLPITVGIASTKFLAKVASAVAKPDGLLLVAPGGELAFLHPLPIERLWGVGPATSGKLRGQGITTVGEVARLTEPTLMSILGPASGRHLYALAHNHDPRRVRVRRRRASTRFAGLAARPAGGSDEDGRAAPHVGRRRAAASRDSLRNPLRPQRGDARSGRALRLR